jgi:hypothetical protein
MRRNGINRSSDTYCVSIQQIKHLTVVTTYNFHVFTSVRHPSSSPSFLISLHDCANACVWMYVQSNVVSLAMVVIVSHHISFL